MYDILIKNSLILNGNGKLGEQGDLAVKNGRIAAVDRLIDGRAARTIDGRGLALAPGFIDLHAHTDHYHLSEPAGDIKLRQGVCLDVVGNCGVSAAPVLPDPMTPADDGAAGSPGMPFRSFSEYRAALDSARPAMRVMSHVGHSLLRTLAMGEAAGPPDPGRLATMKRELEDALDQGAAGLSTGLYYPPSGFADEKEVVELARVVASRGGFHASHIRNEAEDLLASLDEMIRISESSGVAGHVSHLKAAGRNNWVLAEEAVKRLETARARGLDITCDVYPYFHSSTTILALVPPWAQDGGVAGLLPRLKDPVQRERIVGQMKDGLPGWENIYHNAGFEGITITAVQTEANKSFQGNAISQSARKAGQDPFDFVLDLITAEEGRVSIIAASMNEENVARFIALPFSMIGSDGSPTAGLPHPRLYGAFPRVIRRFVRELKVLTLEQAVAKMTALPAQRLGLKDTGCIRKDYRADLVLFDPETFADTATFDRPRSFPVGLEAVVINGEIVFEHGTGTEARPGGFVPARTC